MSEHKNTPELRFPEFKDEWYQSNLDEMCSFTSGGTPSRKINKYWDGDIPWITTSDLNNKFIKNIFTKITSSGLKNSSAKLITEPAIILAMYGQGKTRGKCSILNFPATTNQACAILQPNEFNNIEFVYQFLEKNYTYLRAQSNEGSQKNLSLSLLKKIKINYPSLFEQNKISDFFSKLDRQIELEEEKLELLEQQKRGYIQKIFSQELRFKDENGKEYPKWEEKTIKDVYKVTRGYVLSKKEIKENIDSEYNYPVYSSQTSNNGLMGYYNKFLYENAITWTTDGANAGRVNFRREKFYCTNVCGVLLSDEGYSNKCMAEKLNSIAYKYVSKVGNPKLMNNVMSNIKLSFPCLEEQAKISKLLILLDKLIDKQKIKVSQLKHRKQGLLQRMFV
ncbi:restriction endonuclease subunit S [Staphylococcus petrasii]|uniref:restriction endonuclease subunit S n=1 Tax=Staphylococcus petrasii TaxID=1276936 RepID=UPI003F6764F4